MKMKLFTTLLWAVEQPLCLQLKITGIGLVRKYQRSTARLLSNVSETLNRFFFRIASNVWLYVFGFATHILSFKAIQPIGKTDIYNVLATGGL